MTGMAASKIFAALGTHDVARKNTTKLDFFVTFGAFKGSCCCRCHLLLRCCRRWWSC